MPWYDPQALATPFWTGVTKWVAASCSLFSPSSQANLVSDAPDKSINKEHVFQNDGYSVGFIFIAAISYLGCLVVMNRSMGFLEESANINFWISLQIRGILLPTPAFQICLCCMWQRFVQLEPWIRVLHFHNILLKMCEQQGNVTFVSSTHLRHFRINNF